MMEYSTMESLGREKPAGTRELRRTPWILSDPLSTSLYIYKNIIIKQSDSQIVQYHDRHRSVKALTT
jgi:hypothetical protein